MLFLDLLREAFLDLLLKLAFDLFFIDDFVTDRLIL